MHQLTISACNRNTSLDEFMTGTKLKSSLKCSQTFDAMLYTLLYLGINEIIPETKNKTKKQ